MSKRNRFIILFIIVIAVLYFIEKRVDLANEEYPELTEADRETSLEFEEDVFPMSTTATLVHHAYYSLSYSEPYEQAEWVAYELKKSHLSYNKFDRPYFVQDREVQTGSADWRNYKNSGFDRGHLCPAGDRRFSYEAFLETFLTSNISPMNHDFNRGVWNDLEKQVRRWAKIKDGVFVITGGVLSDNLNTIGEEGVGVPDHFYKIVANRTKGNWELIAFLIPNRPISDSYREYTTTIDNIEAKTGIDFFPNFEDDLEEKLESSLQRGPWF